MPAAFPASKPRRPRPRTTGLGSRYPWVRDRDVRSGAAVRLETQGALVERYWRCFRSADLDTRISDFRSESEPVGEFLQRMLVQAALPLVTRRFPEEVPSSRDEVKHATVLADNAGPFLRWAQDRTRVSNPQVLVDFAVQMAYDHARRGQVMFTLGEPPPSMWWWSGGRQRCWPRPSGYFPPVLGKDLDQLVSQTDKYVPARNDERFQIAKFSSVSPFLGLPQRDLWSLDPVRPPIQAIRVAAEVIHRHVGHGSGLLRVLGVELGHSIGGQALSAFLRNRAAVFSVSSFYDEPHRETLVPADLRGAEGPDPINHSLDLDGCPEADKLRLVEPFLGVVGGSEDHKADAVVLNLPSLRQAGWMLDVARRSRMKKRWPRWAGCLVLSAMPTPMSGQENDYYHQMKPTLAGDAWEHLLRYSLERLSAKGVLVVLADVDCGVHHGVSKALEAKGDLQSIKLTADGSTVAQMEYTSGPPRRLGVLPATGRFLSVWRRMR